MDQRHIFHKKGNQLKLHKTPTNPAREQNISEIKACSKSPFKTSAFWGDGKQQRKIMWKWKQNITEKVTHSGRNAPFLCSSHQPKHNCSELHCSC